MQLSITVVLFSVTTSVATHCQSSARFKCLFAVTLVIF